MVTTAVVRLADAHGIVREVDIAVVAKDWTRWRQYRIEDGQSEEYSHFGILTDCDFETLKMKRNRNHRFCARKDGRRMDGNNDAARDNNEDKRRFARLKEALGHTGTR